jgi:hypothetical protein
MTTIRSVAINTSEEKIFYPFGPIRQHAFGQVRVHKPSIPHSQRRHNLKLLPYL